MEMFIFLIEIIRLWFLRPLKDIKELCKRQDAISYLSSYHHAEVTDTLSDCLRHIKNVPVSLLPLLQ